MSITFLAPFAQGKKSGGILRWQMAKVRQVVALEFGQRLETCRGKRSRQAVANQLRKMSIRIDPSTLHQYEHGTVAAPDPRVLWGLSHIYGVTLDYLTAPLVPGSDSPRASVTPAMSEAAERVARAYDAMTPVQQKAIVGQLEALGFNLRSPFAKAPRRKHSA